MTLISGYAIRELAPDRWALLYNNTICIQDMSMAFANAVLDECETAESVGLELAREAAHGSLVDQRARNELQAQLDTLHTDKDAMQLREAMAKMTRDCEQIRAVMPDLERDAGLWRDLVAKRARDKERRASRKECERLTRSIQQHGANK